MRRSPSRAARPPSTSRGAPTAALALALALAGCGDQIVGTFDPSRGNAAVTTDETGVASTSAVSLDTTAAGTTAAGTTAAGTTDAPAPEVCDGIDNDLDGLVDEVAPGLTECNGCRLLQGAGQAWWVCAAEKTWDQAGAYCQSLGATTAIVPSPAAQAFLHEAVGQGFHWLGARQAELEGAWSWVDGTPWDYTNWGTLQPDDTAPGQDCLRLTFGIVGDGWFDGAWDDYFCDDVHPFMCSAPHEP
jgi:hypothetical protein